VARFLIIDDDETVGLALGRMLEVEGHEALRALSAEAGLAMAASDRPDAIIVDMRMPVMGGLELLRVVRADTDLKSLPVGIVTGDYFLDDEVIAELHALGACMRIKPIDLQTLSGLARELLGERPPDS
jgi:two-component system response regulator MprA